MANISNSKKVIPTQIEFVDIAGLVKGASKGEGLGNQFLSHIREVDAIIHVLRCFEDVDITHVEGDINPIRDAEIIETELVLADLETVERRIANMEKKVKSGDKSLFPQYELLKEIVALLAEGKPARLLPSSTNNYELIKQLQLITSKPIMYVSNVLEDDAVDGNEYSKKVFEKAQSEGNQAVVISSKIEEEVAALESEDERKEFLEAIGLSSTGLSQIIRSGYNLLDLTTFFTSGPKEVRAWTVKRGSFAPQAAGVIHTDFEKGFIRAEVISYNDFITYKGESGSKDAGKMRLEGKEYIVQDGDIIHFRFNV